MVPCTDPSEWGENHVCVCVCVCVCVLISRVFPSISATVTVFVSTDTMQEKKILLYCLQWQEQSLTERDKA